MNDQKLTTFTLGSIAVAVLGTLIPAAASAQILAKNDNRILVEGGKTEIQRLYKRRFVFEVAENAAKFSFDEAPVTNGFPTYGNPFITKGFIYPEGTLKDTDGDGAFDNGVVVETNDDGQTVVRPEFPDKVIGLWICRGTVMSDGGFEIETGPTVHTKQLYDFHEIAGGFGRMSLTSDGLELIDLDVALNRAITGGTGPLRRTRGEVRQTFVGVNASGGFNLRFEVVSN